MPGTRTADKAFGESMDHKPSMLQPSQGQLEGQQKTEEDVIKFLQEVFPDIEIFRITRATTENISKILVFANLSPSLLTEN